MRDQRLEAGRAALASRKAEQLSVDEAVRFLAARGLDENEVRAGSVPQASLDYIRSFAVSELPGDQPLLGLHIGNFVGVSLAYLSATLFDRNPDSQVWSIDPNIAHRGIQDPAGHAFALLGHFGLLGGNVVMTGYTLEQNTGDESDPDPVVSFEAERRSEQVLPNLAARMARSFDLVFIDGNHDGRYLEREIDPIRRLLRPGGLMVIDDVDTETWRMVGDIFDRLAGDDAFEEVGRDGRVGLLRMRLDPRA